MAYPGEKEYIKKVNKRLSEAVDGAPEVEEPSEVRGAESGAYKGLERPDRPYKDTLKYGDEKKPVKKRKKIMGVF